MFIKRGETAAWVLSIVGVAESTYYERKKRERSKPPAEVLHTEDSKVQAVKRCGRPIPGYSLTLDGERVSDEQIEEWLMEFIAGEEHIYGYEKLTICLREQHRLRINKDKVYRLCKKLDILQPQRRVMPKHPRRLALTREITSPNQLWECDIKYGHVDGIGRFLFILSFFDVYDKSVVGQYRGPTCEGKHLVQTMEQALKSRGLDPQRDGTGPIIRSDNGPQFVSRVFEEACERLHLIHERIPPNSPNKNAHIGSYHSQLERDLLRRNEFATFEEAYAAIDAYLEFYNERRIHRSIFMMSPARFLRAWQLKQTKQLVVKV